MKKKLSLPIQILIALVAGVVIGLLAAIMVKRIDVKY